MANRPAPEIDVTEALVRRLLTDQFPELAGRALRELSRGWDNTNLRLGEDLIVRVPHRRAATALIDHEQTWLPELAGRIDLPIPAPTHRGTATDYYPWPWSITPFLAGDEAARSELLEPDTTARTLGVFFRQVHEPAPSDAPTNPFRGCPLHDRAESFETNLARLGPEFDRSDVAAIFDEACEVRTTTERVWLHGDLHTRNMIVHNGHLAAIIDWGDICSGDRATDLAGAFMLVPHHLQIVKEHAGADEAAWARARGWAVHFAIVYLANSDDDPVMRDIGVRLLATLLGTLGSAVTS